MALTPFTNSPNPPTYTYTYSLTDLEMPVSGLASLAGTDVIIREDDLLFTTGDYSFMLTGTVNEISNDAYLDVNFEVKVFYFTAVAASEMVYIINGGAST